MKLNSYHAIAHLSDAITSICSANWEYCDSENKPQNIARALELIEKARKNLLSIKAGDL